ncbi:hypothetical protein Tco_1016300 [Tanacetum coccineum]|uniref:Uncharacterized protein n=1 Tax=Tanacetum coccineum TaxID=301880 RepID=A0ABQ5FN71_9ASTR
MTAKLWNFALSSKMSPFVAVVALHFGLIKTNSLIAINILRSISAARSRRSKRKDTEVPQPSGPTTIVADEVVNEEMDDSLVRDATTDSSLEAEQDSGNIIKTRSKATPNEAGSQGTTSGGGPRRQDTIGDTIAQTRFKNVSKTSNDSLLAGVNTPRSDEDRLKLNELMEFYTKLQQEFLTWRTQRLLKLRRLQGRYGDDLMFDTCVLDDENNKQLANRENDEVNIVTAGDAIIVSAATTTTATIKTVDDITLAQHFNGNKKYKNQPKEKELFIQELVNHNTISSQLTLTTSRHKGKGILIEPVKPMEKKNQIRFDEETALNLQEEFDEEERLEREKAKKEEEANIALIETWDDIQAKINVDHQLAERMQAQEEEELSIEEKATLFQQLLDKRRKHFAAKRAEEKKKPPTKAQQRKIMCTYLKNMEGYKLKDLKFKEFDSIQEMFDRAFKRVEDDKETAELKQCLEIIPDEEEVTIDAIPLAVKSPSIVGWKIYKEGRKSYYQIMRANGKSQTYMIFSQMLKSFDRQDLEDLYKLVKAKYESTRPVKDLDLLLWGDLKKNA